MRKLEQEYRRLRSDVVGASAALHYARQVCQRPDQAARLAARWREASHGRDGETVTLRAGRYTVALTLETDVMPDWSHVGELREMRRVDLPTVEALDNLGRDGDVFYLNGGPRDSGVYEFRPPESFASLVAYFRKSHARGEAHRLAWAQRKAELRYASGLLSDDVCALVLSVSVSRCGVELAHDCLGGIDFDGRAFKAGWDHLQETAAELIRSALADAERNRAGKALRDGGKAA